MLDLGVPFAIYVVFCVVWVVGYFAWALLHRHDGRDDQ